MIDYLVNIESEVQSIAPNNLHFIVRSSCISETHHELSRPGIS